MCIHVLASAFTYSVHYMYMYICTCGIQHATCTVHCTYVSSICQCFLHKQYNYGTLYVQYAETVWFVHVRVFCQLERINEAQPSLHCV